MSHMPIFVADASGVTWDLGIGGTLTWTGVAGFILEAGGTRIATDPFASRPGLVAVLARKPRSDSALVATTFGRLDAIFVNHAHFDHALDVPAILASTPAAVAHGSGTLVELCRRLGCGQRQLRQLRDGERVTVGPFTVEAVGSRHGIVPLLGRVDRLQIGPRGTPLTPIRWPRGDVLAYRIGIGGRTFHIQGSAGIDDHALARQPPADVLIACLAARQGTPGYLDRLAERLRPRFIVACHHDDFFVPLSAPPRPVARLDWAQFLADAKRLRERYGTELVRLPRNVAAGF
jgi:L-ascorbate metabolism protein UlaG (beta-lactamase superfamily)